MKDKWYLYVRSPKTEAITLNIPASEITESGKKEPVNIVVRKKIPQGHPVACISIQVRRTINVVAYGVSAWNPLDTYNKNTARNRADAREAIPGVAHTIPFDEAAKPYELNRRVLEAILSFPQVPHYDHIQRLYVWHRLPTRVLKAIRIMLDTPYASKPRKGQQAA